MSVLERKTTEVLKKEFADASVGIDEETVGRVMRGLQLDGEIAHTEKIRTLRQAWSKYHERIRCA